VLDLDPGTGRDPLDDLRAIDDELLSYSPELAARPQIVVANKADLLSIDASTAAESGPAAAACARIEEHCARHGLPLHVVSAATGRGLPELVQGTARHLEATGWLRVAS
jgi:GTP-binding protein